MGFDLLNNLTNNLLSSQNRSNNTQLGLQDFYNTATERGFARDFHFRVTQIGDSKLTNEDLVYIRSAHVPEREIGTENLAFRGFKYNIPLTSSYPGSDCWTIEFLMDRNYKIYDMLEVWHREHFNEGSFIGREVPTFDKMIELITVDEQMSVVKKFKLYGCFPRKLGQIKYNLGGQGAPVSFNLDIAYQYWTSDTVTIADANKTGLIDGFIKGLNTVTSIVQGGRNIIRSIKSIPGL